VTPSHVFDLRTPPLAKRRCPKCGVPMLLARIEPWDQFDDDERIFECGVCAYAETVIPGITLLR
jgi:ribosomal protein S27AE